LNYIFLNFSIEFEKNKKNRKIHVSQKGIGINIILYNNIYQNMVIPMTITNPSSENTNNKEKKRNIHTSHMQNNIDMAIFGYRKSADAISDYASNMDDKSLQIKKELSIVDMENIRINSLNALAEIDNIKTHLDKYLEADVEIRDPLFKLNELLLREKIVQNNENKNMKIQDYLKKIVDYLKSPTK